MIWLLVSMGVGLPHGSQSGVGSLELPLLEASGDGAGDHVAVGLFCGLKDEPINMPKAAILQATRNGTSFSLSLLLGPTPYTGASFDEHALDVGIIINGAIAADIEGDGVDEFVLSVVK